MKPLRLSKNVLKLFKRSSRPDMIYTVIEFQERILQRLQKDDFPIMERLKLIQILYGNLIDHLMMKVSREDEATTKEALIRTTKLFHRMTEFILQYLTELSQMKQIKLEPFKESNEYTIVYPHSGKRVVYILTYLTSDEMLKKLNPEIITLYKTYEKVYFIRTPKILLNFKSFLKGVEKAVPEKEYYFQKEPKIYEKINYMKELKKKDRLIRVPAYDYQMVLDFIEQISVGPEIETILITLYRFASAPSKIITYLRLARILGKKVIVFIEPNARGNEKENREMTAMMTEWGIQVIYGYPKYKVHSKMCLAVSYNGKIYAHFSTGNYNENTAGVYTDTHLFTADKAKTERALEVFHVLMGRKEIVSKSNKDEIWLNPLHLRSRVLELIQKEIEKRENGYIFMKTNTLSDPEILLALDQAINHGVKVEILVRTTCLLESNGRPNVHIESFCGRYLEHDRIYVFGKKKFISSADMAYRNLHKRIESFVELDEKRSTMKFDELMKLVYTQKYPFIKDNETEEWAIRN